MHTLIKIQQQSLAMYGSLAPVDTGWAQEQLHTNTAKPQEPAYMYTIVNMQTIAAYKKGSNWY